jgi:hypothetical protein
MAKRLLNLLALLSLLPCVAGVVLWTRSYRGSDRVVRLAVASDGRATGLTHLGFITDSGSCIAWRVTYDFPDGPPRGFLEVVGPPGWRIAGAGSPPEAPDERPRFEPPWSPHTEDPNGLSEWEGFGFGWHAASVDPLAKLDGHLLMVNFPLWLPPALFAAPPALALARRLHRRLRRPRPGSCPLRV